MGKKSESEDVEGCELLCRGDWGRRLWEGLALGGGLVPLGEALRSVAEDRGLVPMGELRAGVSPSVGARRGREACARPFFVLVVVGLA